MLHNQYVFSNMGKGILQTDAANNKLVNIVEHFTV